MKTITENDRQRFKALTVDGPVSDYRPDLGPCLLYVGAQKARGYGHFKWDGTTGNAHKFAWESERGELVEETLDHLCRVTNCVRVAHLEPVSRQENYRRARQAAAECRNGHPYPTTEPAGPGRRRCQVCLQAHRERSYEQQKLARLRKPNARPECGVRYEPAVIAAAIAEVAAGSSYSAAAARHGMSRQHLTRLVARHRSQVGAT